MHVNDRRIARIALTELILIVGAWGSIACALVLLFKGAFVGTGLCFAVACVLFSLHAASARRHPAAAFVRRTGGDVS